MVQGKSMLGNIFATANHVFLFLLATVCIFPMIHILAISLSSSSAVTAGLVKLWPVDFNTTSYEYVLKNKEFLTSFLVSLKRILLGVSISMVLTVLLAYPLSKEPKDFQWRTLYVWIFVFSMLFHGGLIPTYIIIRQLGMLDSIWALVIPNGVVVFYVVLMLNFFRHLPKELEEAAFIDGAGHWNILWKIYMPLSRPSLATILLFSFVSQWNEWFQGIIFMNNPENYPLSSYLRTIVTSLDSIMSNASMEDLKFMNDRTSRAAQIFLGSLPLLLVYPFLQKHFASGITLGSVKE